MRGLAGSALVVAVHADPVHVTSALHLFLAHDRRIVFRHAGHDARVTSGAPVQVDAHAPLVSGIAVLAAAGYSYPG